MEATFSELIASGHDCLRVIVRGVVRTADWVSHTDMRAGNHPLFPSLRLQILTDGGVVEAFVDSGDASRLGDLLDAKAEVAGVAGGRFDGKLEQTGVIIHVSMGDDLKIVKRAEGNPWNTPVTPMEKVLRTYKVSDLTGRVRVHGTITYYEPGAAAVLQDGSKSLWLSNAEGHPNDSGPISRMRPVFPMPTTAS